METDYTDNPYNLRIGDTFEQIIKTATGSENLDEPITVEKIQVEWLNTGPMYKLNPNGTLGIHFEFLGQASGKFWSLICDNLYANVLKSQSKSNIIAIILYCI